MTKLRIDQLSHVPQSELRDLLTNRDANELAQLSRKFDSMLPDPKTYANLRPFFQTWAQTDETAAFHSAIALHDVLLRGVAIEAIADSASPEAAGRVTQLLLQEPENKFQETGREQLLAKAVTNWSQSSPAAAAEVLLTDPALRARCGADVLHNWGWIEGPAAISWLDKHPTDEGNREFSQLLIGWVENNAPAVSSYILDHLKDPRALQSVDTAAYGLFWVNKDLALKWAAKLPAGEVRVRAESSIAENYSLTDPVAGIAWSAQLPDEERDGTLRIILAKWTIKDPEAAVAWVNDRSGTIREEALEVVCDAFSFSAPDRALELANRITDKTRRESTLEKVLEQLMERSPEQAAALVQSSSLPPDKKAALLSKKSDDAETP